MTAIEALGWALLHSLWQEALAGAALASLLAIVPARAARTRYALGVATLLAMLLLPLETGLRLRRASPWIARESSAAAALSPAPAPAAPGVSLLRDAERGSGGEARALPQTPRAAATPALAARIRAAIEPMLPGVVLVWFGGVLVLSLRLASGWVASRRLWTVGARPVPEACRAAVSRLAARLRVSRPVRVLESAVVQVPAVIGWLRPLILLPASALTGLTPLQLDALLAHELAHVRRYDYLVNLLQSVIETLLFYHPVVWWVSRHVREAREHCCDDLAVAVCGGPHVYAAALLTMEQLRVATPVFALAAGGGSLLGRVRRLVAPDSTEIFPRWIAGVLAVTFVLTIGSGIGLARATAAPRFVASAAAGTAPDTVLRHPDATRALAERWEWARVQARRIGAPRFWIGYSVRPSPGVAGNAGDATEVDGHGGHGGHEEHGGHFPSAGFGGVALGPLLGASGDSDDTALLFLFVAGRGGGSSQPVLARVHLSSFSLPVDFEGGALLWLGAADDDASLRQLEKLFAEAPTAELKEDVVAGVGLHGAAVAVPVLTQWLAGDEPASVRAEAADWLGRHPDPAAVSALARAARSDRSADVRKEAAEELGHNPFPAATDSLLALVRGLEDGVVRREAVEGLGRKSDPRALPTLIAIARQARDEDMQEEAVEALGRLPHGAGGAALVDLARSQSDPDLRREALKAVAEATPPDVALPVLEAVARGDRDGDVQREAVKVLAKVHDRRAVALLIHFARRHPMPEARREAVEALGEADPSDSAVALLQAIALDGSDGNLQLKAVKSLGKLHRARALGRVARDARDVEVRREAVEHYAEIVAPDTALVFLTERLASDPSPDVQLKALHWLAKLPDGAGLAALAEAARAHPNREVRREARRLEDRSR